MTVVFVLHGERCVRNAARSREMLICQLWGSVLQEETMKMPPLIVAVSEVPIDDLLVDTREKNMVI